MRNISFPEALKEAIDEEMARDETVYVIGEDIAGGYSHSGGAGPTHGLIQKYGKARVKDTPISETVIAGSCVGAAMAGLRPIADMMFGGFVYICMDEIVLKAANWRFDHPSVKKLPIVFRMCGMGYVGAGSTHAQYPTATLWHHPGLKIVVPSTPYDGKGLLKTAIRDNNPVCFLEHLMLEFTSGEVPEEEYTIPFGVADVKRKGKDVTVIATGLMVLKSLEVAKELESSGIDVEVVDLRTLEPLDIKTILASVRKTGRVVIVDEDTKRCGVGAEIGMQIMENTFNSLKAPIQRVGAANLPIPFGILENSVLPQNKDIAAAIKAVLLG